MALDADLNSNAVEWASFVGDLAAGLAASPPASVSGAKAWPTPWSRALPALARALLLLAIAPSCMRMALRDLCSEAFGEERSDVDPMLIRCWSDVGPRLIRG